MNNFTMETFNSGEAFDEPALELARILRELADRIEAVGDDSGRVTLHDLNGNRCGHASFDWKGDE
jgi:hypothetical protein